MSPGEIPSRFVALKVNREQMTYPTDVQSFRIFSMINKDSETNKGI